MHQLIATDSTKMTSKEIAELVESRHDSVKRTVERLSQSSIISQPPLVDGAKSANGQAVKKATKLEIELDRAKQYATVKRMKMLHHGQAFDWRRLRDTSVELEMPTIDVFDANYGTVKAYHADVWHEAYAVSIEQ